jgi:dTDP-4-dehydrorhamnose reductase
VRGGRLTSEPAPKKLVVTGARGLLGSEFMRAGVVRDWRVTGLGRGDLDVTVPGAAAEAFARERPDWVVHCAAYTAVDRAEEEPEAARRVNRDGTAQVAAAAVAAGCRMVYVSSDYVFDGRATKPYAPSAPVGPLSTYARTKREGEVAAEEAFAAPERGLMIVRTGWLYGSNGPNFVRTVIERARAGKPLRVVDDQRGRPTWARNVAESVLDLMQQGAEGVWHVADGGDATWLEFAREALRLGGMERDVTGVSTEEWGAAASRPRYSVLDVSATERALGRPAMPWKDALRAYLRSDMRERKQVLV